jgi:glycosyltransferase 2 family protein
VTEPVVRRRLASTALAAAVSGAVLWWLLAGVDRTALLAALGDASPWRLGLALLLMPLIQWLRAWRFGVVLTGRPDLPSRALIRVAVRLVVYNFLLPFKLGELSFPLMMRRAFDIEYTRSAGILVVVRGLDLSTVAALLCLAAGALLLVAPLALISAAAPLRRAAARAPRLEPVALRLLWGATMLRAPVARAHAFALTLAIWLAHATLGWLAASAVIRGISPVATTLATAASNLAFALPVPVIAGLGPPQAAWAAALRLAGLPWPATVATALVSQAVILCGILALGLASVLASAHRPAAGRFVL